MTGRRWDKKESANTFEIAFGEEEKDSLAKVGKLSLTGSTALSAMVDFVITSMMMLLSCSLKTIVLIRYHVD